MQVTRVAGHPNRSGIVFDDVTARKQAELALKKSEERQAFLLKFSDALRAEPDAEGVANRATQMLSEQMRLDRCYITFYRPDDSKADFPYHVGNDTVPPPPDKVRLSDFPEAYQQVLERTFVEDDFEKRGRSETERANSKALGMRARVASTARKGAKAPICSMAALSSRPRRWTLAKIALVEEAAERTWAAMERARPDKALRTSKVKYRTLFESIDEGFVIAEVLYDAEGRPYDALYLEGNPAASRLTGVPDYSQRLLSNAALGAEPYWLEIYDRVARTDVSERLERFISPLDRWYDFHVSRFTDEVGDRMLDGAPRVAVIFQEITGRKRAEEALRAKRGAGVCSPAWGGLRPARAPFHDP